MTTNLAVQRPATTPAIQKRLRGPFDRDLSRVRALRSVNGAVLQYKGRRYIVQRSKALQTIARFI